MLFAAVRWSRLALSEQSSCVRVCLLLDQNGQTSILDRAGLSANDPKRAFGILSVNVQQCIF
jgi:hypothetical protein